MFQKKVWFQWPPPLLRTAMRTFSGTSFRFAITSVGRLLQPLRVLFERGVEIVHVCPVMLVVVRLHRGRVDRFLEAVIRIRQDWQREAGVVCSRGRFHQRGGQQCSGREAERFATGEHDEYQMGKGKGLRLSYRNECGRLATHRRCVAVTPTQCINISDSSASATTNQSARTRRTRGGTAAPRRSPAR